MVSKFALKFGNDDNSLSVIEACLQARLGAKDKIEAKDFDEIQDEVRHRLSTQNRGMLSRSQYQVPAGTLNQGRSFSALRSSAYPMGDQLYQNGIAKFGANRRAQTKLVQNRSRVQKLANGGKYLSSFDSG